MSNRVTLYRVRRPDGTVIGSLSTCEDGADHSARLVDPQFKSHMELWSDKECMFAADAAAKAGYTIEPVEYAPLASEETRRFVLWLLGDRLGSDSSAALSELERVWGK